ncbi:MAG: MetQ/NlpA family ABC transporter substrate-binding protein, partial [Clostridia bacterium]
ISSTLADVDLAVINGNFALDAGLSPATDAIFLEASDSDAGKLYTNYVVVRPEDKDAKWVEDLRSVICSKKVSDYILTSDQYKGAVIPAFTAE